ncbi:MAG: archease [Deltaproteobacteria bacterium]|nr:archease [Deltaproteobacteria bacterium]
MAREQNDAPLYREIEHAGDIGIEITAPTRSELFRKAAIALADLLVDLSTVERAEDRIVEVTANDDIDLMHDLLTELLQLFAADGFIWREAAVEERGQGLDVVITGESFDPRHVVPRGEIKAVTYHQMTVEQRAKEWRARIIFDV